MNTRPITPEKNERLHDFKHLIMSLVGDIEILSYKRTDKHAKRVLNGFAYKDAKFLWGNGFTEFPIGDHEE